MQKFIDRWKSLGRENADYQKFWIELIQIFCGVEFPTSFLEFQVPVEFENSKRFIDVWIPSTKIIIEHKSRGRKLDKSEIQSDGSMLTPYQQAKRYDDYRTANLKANWIITCNFDEIWIYNLNRPRPESRIDKIALKDLPNHNLQFLVDPLESEIKSKKDISVDAGYLVQDFRDLLWKSDLSDEDLIALNRFCIQLVFCMYAENSGIFKPSQFCNYLRTIEQESKFNQFTSSYFRRSFENLLQRLNTENPPEMMNPLLYDFPYVNGELFKDHSLAILDYRMTDSNLNEFLRKLINASEGIKWHEISPTIFGAIFESIMNPDTKRSGGIHYTSLENIHKVIDPLFLNDLNSEFDRCKSVEDFEKLHDKIANLKFFDPACGSGNFLTETFISLRKLENRIIDQTHGKIRISIENFYGIEINDFAVKIAKLALWISEHQMNGGSNFLPLNRNANIIEGNSLEIDWKTVIPDADFIMGNPPYLGYSMQNANQKSEMKSLFNDNKAAGKMDYVCAWFKKASEYIRDSTVEVGFVATSSITQGEHVGFLWKDLFDAGIKINFARSSFRWENESTDRDSMAQVFCVIVGFARFDRKIKLLDGKRVKNLNGYLRDAPNVCIERTSNPIQARPKMRNGNRPADGGNLIVEAEDLDAFLEKDPRAKKFIKRFIGSEEFINNKPRYCLWLVDVEPNEIKSMKNVYDRVEKCRADRLKGAPDRQKLAKTPWLFREQMNPDHFLVVPVVSSGRREYIPIDFLDSETIPGNQLLIIPDGNLELFGILVSRIHMVWTKTIGSFLGTSYSYSAQVVYNNFPFPKSNPKIESTAQKILDARSNHPNSSLAELYDPNLMPPDLRKAHDENDRAVLDAYKFPRDISESEIVSRLFEMYQDLTK